MEVYMVCRFLYRVPAGTEWYVVEHYGCCNAVSMEDAAEHIHRVHPGVPIYQVHLGEDGSIAADYGDQEYRKSLYDFAAATRSPEITH
jgi:hypothetical protein